MKHYQFTILTATLLTCSFAQAAGERTAFQIIIDDSGVLQSSEDAQTYKMALLGHLKNFTRRRSLAQAPIDVISMSYGRTVWTGTPLDLKRKPERAQDLVQKIEAQKDNCSNLRGAFMELKSNYAALARQGYESVHTIVFGSLIHTPLPCKGLKAITLPQLPPMDSDINDALMSSPLVKSISFYWVSPHQKRVWEEHLVPSFNWAIAQDIPFTFLDEERSKYALTKRLQALEVRK